MVSMLSQRYYILFNQVITEIIHIIHDVTEIIYIIQVITRIIHIIQVITEIMHIIQVITEIIHIIQVITEILHIIQVTTEINTYYPSYHRENFPRFSEWDFDWTALLIHEKVRLIFESYPTILYSINTTYTNILEYTLIQSWDYRTAQHIWIVMYGCKPNRRYE